MPKKLPRSFGCPSEFTLEVLGGKWKTVILCHLRRQPLRFTELRRLIPALSDKVLTERLVDLGARGLVSKKRIGGPERLRDVYVLTPMGKTLTAALTELYRWGEKHAVAFGVTVTSPLARLE